MGTNFYNYDAAGQLLSEGGLWPNDVVNFIYANRLRNSMSIMEPNASAWDQSYGYDNARRLSSVTSLAGSFGYTLSISGPLGDANAYRFSSKEWNENSGLYYYLYRFYDPNCQRWPNRDPIGERGGLNLYGYVGNSPINRIDPLGLDFAGMFNGWNPYYQPPPNPSPFNSTYGFGITGGVNVDGGYGIVGAVANFSGGIGLFHNPQDGFSIGSFLSAGAFFGGPLGSINFPKDPCQHSGVFGKSAGFGGGAFFTNAGNSSALAGGFNQWNVNLPDVSGSFGQSGDTTIWSLTGGYSAGSSVSAYPTTTFGTSSLNLSTGELK